MKITLSPKTKTFFPNLVLTFCIMAGETAGFAADQVIPPQPARSPAVANANGTGPKIQFATPIHDFGKISGGTVVKYDFIFTNTGDQPLEISNVQPGCGCTTAGAWSRQVEPGKTGNIPIQFNSGNFTGQVGKSVTVTSNDKTQPTVMLQFKGTIWRPIEVSPQYAVLNLTTESPSNSTTVHIVNNAEQPLTISSIENNNRAFAVELKTNTLGKDYQLVIKTTPPWPSNITQGFITLKTSSQQTPLINITALANVQQTLTITPTQIRLPAGPISQKLTQSITIRYGGTNLLELSEPTINAEGVDVKVNKLQPGRFFNISMTFPAGFQIAAGEKIELRVKSNNPQFPILKVPLIQHRTVAPAPLPPAPPMPK